MDLAAYALLFIGTPYLWGGNSLVSGAGVDCSGFIQEILASENIDPRGDQTAQGLFDGLRHSYETHSINPNTHIKRNYLLFFGQTTQRITHIAMAIDDDGEKMVEAGGGGSRTKTRQDAIDQNAMVRIRPISNRRDLIAVIKIY